MKTKGEIIFDMCLCYCHDHSLEGTDEVVNLMTQIYNNCIEPYMEISSSSGDNNRLSRIEERLEKLESNQAYLLNAANRADMYTLPIGGVSEGFTDNSKSYDEYFRELRRED